MNYVIDMRLTYRLIFAVYAVLWLTPAASAATVSAGWTADGDADPSDGWTASIGTGHDNFDSDTAGTDGAGPDNPPTRVAISDAGAQAFTGQSFAYDFDGSNDDCASSADWPRLSGMPHTRARLILHLKN